jgi:hypothetical protein
LPPIEVYRLQRDYITIAGHAREQVRAGGRERREDL